MDDLQLLISPDEIRCKIVDVARLIDEEYAGKELVIVIVMKGAICLASDLIRSMKTLNTIEYVRASSYGQRGTSPGDITVSGLDDIDLTSKHVLLVDDIFDTGVTLNQIFSSLKKKHPQSLKSLVLLSKSIPRGTNFVPDYVLFEIKNVFVVGYGLDYKEHYRGLPGIYALNTVS